MISLHLYTESQQHWFYFSVAMAQHWSKLWLDFGVAVYFVVKTAHWKRLEVETTAGVNHSKCQTSDVKFFSDIREFWYFILNFFSPLLFCLRVIDFVEVWMTLWTCHTLKKVIKALQMWGLHQNNIFIHYSF